MAAGGSATGSLAPCAPAGFEVGEQDHLEWALEVNAFGDCPETWTIAPTAWGQKVCFPVLCIPPRRESNIQGNNAPAWAPHDLMQLTDLGWVGEVFTDRYTSRVGSLCNPCKVSPGYVLLTLLIMTLLAHACHNIAVVCPSVPPTLFSKSSWLLNQITLSAWPCHFPNGLILTEMPLCYPHEKKFPISSGISSLPSHVLAAPGCEYMQWLGLGRGKIIFILISLHLIGIKRVP